MIKNRDKLSEEDIEYIHKMLDKINVPRVSKAGNEFSLFGRIVVLVETIISENLLYK